MSRVKGGRNTAECFSLQETLVWKDDLGLLGLLLPDRPQIICPLCHIQQPQSCGLPISKGYCSLLLWFVILLTPFTGWWVDEKKHRLLFQLIIWARVTTAPVIEPVMMIWFHQAARIKRTGWLKSGESVELCSASASSSWRFSQSLPGDFQGFPHCTQKGCEGAKQGFTAEATMTLEHGVGAKRSNKERQRN